MWCYPCSLPTLMASRIEPVGLAEFVRALADEKTKIDPSEWKSTRMFQMACRGLLSSWLIEETKLVFARLAANVSILETSAITEHMCQQTWRLKLSERLADGREWTIRRGPGSGSRSYLRLRSGMPWTDCPLSAKVGPTSLGHPYLPFLQWQGLCLTSQLFSFPLPALTFLWRR